MERDPTIKIALSPGLEEADANSLLYKATGHHVDGDAHSAESFDDPAMVDVSQRMIDIHDKIYQEMLQEIMVALDQEYEK